MKKKVFYMSGTHWDREWYQPFQGFRLQLVDACDHLLEVLENDPSFKVFHFDGQTIVLEDYAEVCPENRDRLKKLIADGRVLVGPWYCMPDEFLVSGEALIRNFQIGHELSRQWGAEAWKCGYVSDIFGHIAQFPQILNGFDIHTAALSRGTNDAHFTPFFVWRSPDGSEVLAYKMPEKSGYGSFAMDVVGQRHCDEYCSPDSPEFEARAREYLDTELNRSEIPVAMIMDCHDHEPIHRDAPRYLARLQEMYPDVDFELTNLLDAFRAVEPYRDRMTVNEGELNETAYAKGLHLYLLSHTLSSRYELKKENDRCQSLLERWLEPMYCVYDAMGQGFKQQYLQIAWKHLLQNQPHDSICGCSVDRVHRDMEYRYSQVESLYRGLMERCEQRVAGGRHLLDCRGVHDRIQVINPLPYEYAANVTVELPFEQDYPTWHEPFGYQEIKAFRLYAEDGTEIPYVVRDIVNNGKFRTAGERTAAADLYTVTFPLTLAPCGSVEVRVMPKEDPVRFPGTLVSRDGTLENDYLRLTVNSDGTINMEDKSCGKTYPRLCGLFDAGEIGDGWNSVSPCTDEVVTSGVLRGVTITASGPAYSEIRIDRDLWLPEKLEYGAHNLHRAEEKTALHTSLYVGLGREDQTVSLRLKVLNNVKDHKLKIRIPTGVAKQEYEVSQSFAFLRRACGVKAETADWKEADALEKAMSGIVLKRDDEGHGVAFVSQGGLHECAADTDRDGSLYITLLRSFCTTITTNGEIGGQSLGEHEYVFSLVPLTGERSNWELQRLQETLAAGVRSFVTEAGKKLPSYLEVTGKVSISAMKPAEDRSGDLILRVYNPTDHTEKAGVRFGGAVRRVMTANLREDVGAQELPVSEQSVSFSVKPFEIYTLRIVR